MKKIFVLLLSAGLLVSCSEYQKALKSEDSGLKYAQAEKKYDQGKYSKAIRLFEQMAPNYKGKPQAEKMFYMFAMSYYKTEQYYLSGYQFETFAAGYPKSEKAEEAAFLSAKSYAKLSPSYSLDQVDTNKAIDKLQAFIDKYPDSEFLKEANETMKGLREKLEKKAYLIAYGYNKISDYKSAIVAFDNFVADYPGTPFKEKALYYRLDSSYKLAINSIPAKMEERLNQAKGAYSNLLKFYPNTEYKKDADEMLAKIENDLKQFSK
ncbi:outer membrane protein assembly factor BamD [Flavobacterium sp. MAH-1]|uniref:Outer membrane protein assembly factor BamD n=1 Tax=Flavobacterium agri TaxID=2743471 RepID=A0A7Y9C6D4_9FLAO|nr:outer membrane protein assembly factor BamD [Flavobacterium agri]NUY82262.1 outer membrane protein assembly factor BamD [Flavobacterium agri]NYA72286.1 outer membrane protein assembly factor BamD [Flavobacterium agri]